MQESWRTDADKLTFIICLPLAGRETHVIAGVHDAPAKMIGDVNLFLTEGSEDGDGNGDLNTLVGEIELMIATKENQGHGYGRASLLAFLQFIHAHKEGILKEYKAGRDSSERLSLNLAYLRVKIAESNGRSIRLFESIGFERVSAKANYFGEVELRLLPSLSEALVSLRQKFGIPEYQEWHYG